MLEALRKSATGILAKALIALLVLSFAVWGVADMITGVSRTAIATIGDKEISIYEFRRHYQDQVDAVSRRFGRRLTPQQARLFGVEKQVLETMIGALAVDTHAAELNLSITDDMVEQNIRDDQLFKGADGQFDPDRLRSLLAQVGFSEGQFMASRRSDIIRDQLTGAMLENVAVPQYLRDLVRTYREEKRKVRYFTIDPKVAIKLPTPTEEVLKKTYEANKPKFMTDETRRIEVLLLTSQDAQKRIKVTEAQLQERYERDKQRYAVPELRQVLQIPFKDAAAATTARQAILDGKDFAAVAKDSGAKASDIDLGLVAKDKLIDPKIAAAAFGLEKDKVSEVVAGRFSTVLLMVKDIRPGKVPTFAEIKSQLRDSITSRLAPDEIRTLHDQVDDNRLAGKSLKDIAGLLGLTLTAFDAITQAGKDASGQEIFKSPDRDSILKNAFESSVGVENEVIELADGGYAWVRVLAINKAEQKPFDAVRADVAKLWTETETWRALSEIAQDYVGKLKAGATFEDVAKSAGGEVKVTPAFKRGDSLPNLSPAAVGQAFSLAKGVAAATETSDGKSRMVVAVIDIIAPATANAEEQKRLDEELTGQLRTDTVDQYVSALRNRLGVETNQALIDQTVGIVAQ